MSGQPCHDLRDRSGFGAGRYGGAVDQDDGDLQAAGGFQFRIGPRAACVLGDDMGYAVVTQQGGVGGFVERAFGDEDGRVRQGKRGFGFVDKAQDVVVLGVARETVEPLLADGEKDAGGNGGKRACRLIGVGNRGPAVGGRSGPGRAFKGEKRGLRGRAGGDGIGAHLCGKGVGGVDDVCDAFGAQVVGEALGAAKASGSGGQRLGYGGVGASGVREDGVGATGGKFAGKEARFGGAAEEEDARHG